MSSYRPCSPLACGELFFDELVPVTGHVEVVECRTFCGLRDLRAIAGKSQTSFWRLNALIDDIIWRNCSETAGIHNLSCIQISKYSSIVEAIMLRPKLLHDGNLKKKCSIFTFFWGSISYLNLKLSYLVDFTSRCGKKSWLIVHIWGPKRQ